MTNRRQTNLKRISLRITKEYFDLIKSGKKTIEFRPFSPFWRARLDSLCLEKKGADPEEADDPKAVAVFVSGKAVHRRLVTRVKYIPTPSFVDHEVVRTNTCYALYLGKVMRDGTTNKRRTGE